MWLCKRDLSKECEGKYRDCTDCVLGKIRAEIEQSYCKVENDYDQGRNYGLYMSMHILDKYKAESEESNG